jgi:hypothetical protein
MSKLVDDVLAHHGVKGMKWGERKAAKPAKLSRKQVKAEKHAFYQNKANSLVQEALKNPKTLIALNTGGTFPTIVTGREFITHLSNGGVMNIKATDVYARQGKDGAYVLNDNPNQKYQRSDK